MYTCSYSRTCNRQSDSRRLLSVCHSEAPLQSGKQPMPRRWCTHGAATPARTAHSSTAQHGTAALQPIVLFMPIVIPFASTWTRHRPCGRRELCGMDPVAMHAVHALHATIVPRLHRGVYTCAGPIPQVSCYARQSFRRKPGNQAPPCQKPEATCRPTSTARALPHLTEAHDPKLHKFTHADTCLIGPETTAQSIIPC